MCDKHNEMRSVLPGHVISTGTTDGIQVSHKRGLLSQMYHETEKINSYRFINSLHTTTIT
jgi:2-keto-4-pentenoate hydratase/2-oxohepta-3-ene-1,7-dioic acid hydratase in catechol pathway